MQKILIIKPSALGDIIQAIPCAVALRKNLPNAHISWIVKKEFVDVLRGIDEIDEIIPWDYAVWKKGNICEKIKYAMELRRTLRNKKIDMVLDLQGLLKSVVLAAMTSCKQRYGYSDMREGSQYFTQVIKGKYSNGHVVQRYLDVVRHIGVHIDVPEFVLPRLAEEDKYVNGLLLELHIERFIAIAPSTSIQAKEWPIERYVELIKKLLNGGYNVGLVGTKAEKAKSKYIMDAISVIVSKENSGKIVDFTGMTNIRQLMSLLKKSQLLVAGDTGPTHIAVAAGIPVVGLYGQRSPERSGPYGENNKIIWHPPTCAPCWRKKCYPLICMDNINVEEVFEGCLDICRR